MIPNNELDPWLFRLFMSNEVLSEFEDAIRDLFAICSDKREVKLVQHTLSNMSALSTKQQHYGLMAIADIAQELYRERGDLAVVAMAYDSAPDSSQAVVQGLKPLLIGQPEIKIFNSVPNYLKKLPQHLNFMLVDDFSGTGNTVLNRIKHIKDNAKGRDVSVSGTVGLIACMETARNRIVAEGHTLNTVKLLKAGISGYFEGQCRDNMIESMKRLETELLPRIGEIDVPSLGYGDAEAMHFVHRSNAPNSNFPIFWWPISATNVPRRTLMQRAEF